MKKIIKILTLMITFVVSCLFIKTETFASVTVGDVLVSSTVGFSSSSIYENSYGEKIPQPHFTITTAYYPGEIYEPKCNWYKKVGDEYEVIGRMDDNYCEYFTDGEYRFEICLRFKTGIENDYDFTGGHPNLNLGGSNWTFTEQYSGQDSYKWYEFYYVSKTFIVLKKYNTPFKATAFPNMNIPNSNQDVAIDPVDLSVGVLGGKSPYTYAKISGPSWVKVSSDGIVTGTPNCNKIELDDLVVKISDSEGASETITLDVGRIRITHIEATSNIVLPVAGKDVQKMPVIIPDLEVIKIYPANSKYGYCRSGWSVVIYDKYLDNTKYYFSAELRVEGANGSRYVISDQLELYVDGVKWTMSPEGVEAIPNGISTASFSSSEYIAHDYKLQSDTSTCTKAGKQTWKCSECTDSFTVDVQAKEHTYVIDPEVKATCTKTGKTEGKHCSVCNTVLVEQKTTPKLSHTPGKATLIKAASVKADGKAVTKCKVCAQELSSQVIRRAYVVMDETAAYTGKNVKQEVKIIDKNGNKISKDNYSISYKNNKKIGKATATIIFKGNYTGTVKKNFIIANKSEIPAVVSGLKVTSGKKSLSLSWKKASVKCTGYEIKYSKDKNFLDKSTVTNKIKNASTSKLNIIKLSAKTGYYVKIRAVGKDSKKNTIYSKWSKVKKITTK